VLTALKKTTPEKSFWLRSRQAARKQHAISEAVSIKLLQLREFCEFKAHLFSKRCVVAGKKKDNDGKMQQHD